MIIYSATHKTTGRKYIGKTTKNLRFRMKQHVNDANCTGSTYFHKALAKYGAGMFDWVEEAVCESRERLDAVEMDMIFNARRDGVLLYNMTIGGDGGSRPGVMNPSYGKTLPDEVRRKISSTLKGVCSGKNNPMYGRRGALSPGYGKKHTPAARAKISSAKKGMERPDMLGAANSSARAVINETTGEIFAYATLAAKKYGADLSSLIKCCKGKIKTCAGQKFRYLPGVYGWTKV